MERKTGNKGTEQAAVAAVKKIGRPFQIVEAYKTLRTNLLFTLATTDRKIVVISSPEPHAGKSTTAANLAVVMAQSNLKVLLVDADMRKPTLDRIFRVSRADGLSKLLSGMTTFKNAVIREVAPGLDFLPSGPTPPNQQELLGSAAMNAFLSKAQEQYDYIFIDTPPVNLVADALLLLKDAAGMLLVVREGSTTHDDLRATEETVAQMDGHILGVLLTDVKQKKGMRRQKYYKSGDYEYGKE